MSNNKNNIECPKCKHIGIMIYRDGNRVCPECFYKWDTKYHIKNRLQYRKKDTANYAKNS